MIREADPERRAALARSLPPAMIRAAYYVPFGIAHDWTPKQVDEIPADILPYYLPVEGVLKAFMDEQAERRAKSSG